MPGAGAPWRWPEPVPLKRTPGSDTFIVAWRFHATHFPSSLHRRFQSSSRCPGRVDRSGQGRPGRWTCRSRRQTTGWTFRIPPVRSVRPAASLERALAQRRAGNATLKMEREILKKATVFFARKFRRGTPSSHVNRLVIRSGCCVANTSFLKTRSNSSGNVTTSRPCGRI